MVTADDRRKTFKNVERLAAGKGESVYKMAKATGINPSTLSHWKTGRSVPGTQTLIKIAQYYGEPVERLVSNG